MGDELWGGRPDPIFNLHIFAHILRIFGLAPITYPPESGTVPFLAAMSADGFSELPMDNYIT
jgi:hypothetical protein